MKASNKAGFTIIETMLFLGISGMLLAGILVGTGTSISIQRYRDSVTSLQSYLQQQYSEVSDVSNDSLTNSCYGDGSTDNPRGQSDCVILGKLITTTDEHTLSISNVIGYIPSGSTSSLNDVDIFLKNGNGTQKGYDIKISSVDEVSYNMEWDASLMQAKPNDAKPAAFSVLIVRSPSSGLLRTFSDSTQSISEIDDVQSLITQSALGQQVKMCVSSNGLLTGPKMAVVVDAYTTNSSGVESSGEYSGC